MLFKMTHADTDKKYSILKLNQNGLVIAVETYSEQSGKLTGVTSYPSGIEKKKLPLDTMNMRSEKKVVIKKIVHEEMVEEEVIEPVEKKSEPSSISNNEPVPAEPEQPKSKKEKKKDGGN